MPSIRAVQEFQQEMERRSKNAALAARTANDPVVVVYSKPGCRACEYAKDLLLQCGVQYWEKDVGYEPSLLAEMATKTNRLIVPVIDIMGDIVVGYDATEIERLLRLHRLVK